MLIICVLNVYLVTSKNKYLINRLGAININFGHYWYLPNIKIDSQLL